MRCRDDQLLGYASSARAGLPLPKGIGLPYKEDSKVLVKLSGILSAQRVQSSPQSLHRPCLVHRPARTATLCAHFNTTLVPLFTKGSSGSTAPSEGAAMKMYQLSERIEQQLGFKNHHNRSARVGACNYEPQHHLRTPQFPTLSSPATLPPPHACNPSPQKGTENDE